MPPFRSARGFTAIELMVTVAVLAVLAAIAAPSFKPLFERWQVRQATEELQSTLYFARSEAVKRGGGIGIQANASLDGCSVSETELWNCGWVVFIDKNNNGTNDSGDEEIQRTAPPSHVKVQSGLSNPVLADRWGQLSSNGTSNFVFRLTTQGGDTSNASATSLCINGGGRIKRLNSGTASCA